MKKLTLEEAFLAIEFESTLPWSPCYKGCCTLDKAIFELFDVNTNGFKYYVDKEVFNEILNYYSSARSVKTFITKYHLQKFKKNGFYSIVASLKDTGFYPISKEYFNTHKDVYGEDYYKLLEKFNEKIFKKGYKRKLTLEEAFVALVFETTLPWSRLYKGKANIEVALNLFGVNINNNVIRPYYIDSDIGILLKDMIYKKLQYNSKATINDLINELQIFIKEDIKTIIAVSKGVYPVTKEYFKDNKDMFGEKYYDMLEEFNKRYLG